MPRALRAALAASVVLPLLAGPARGEDAPAAPLSAPELLAKVSPAVVNLRYVLKWADGEQPYTAVGTIVEPTGLLVLGNDYLGSGKTKAVDLKVTFAGDPKEWEAVVVARDGVLNLAWVQVLGLEKPIPAVDLTVGADPAVGQDVVSVWRTSRSFDHAPAAGRHYVVSHVEKPRAMWSLGGESTVVGSPVFDVAGHPVGVMATQGGSSSDEDEEGGAGSAFLLPLVDVRKSLDLAKKRVPEAVEKAKASAAEKPAAPEAPAMADEPPGKGDAPMDGPPMDGPPMDGSPMDGAPKDTPPEAPKPPTPEQPK